jgi:hypothetical protein
VFSQYAGEHLDHFSLLEVKGDVYVRCIISSGQTCNGINILRSEDSLTFAVIGHIGGVCGSLTAPEEYHYLDQEAPKNKRLYYKVELNGYGFSEIREIQVVDTKEFGFQVRPNPASGNVTIFFENAKSAETIFTLTNSLGNTVFSSLTNLNFVYFNVSSFPAGIYYFTLDGLSNFSATKGKLIVAPE